MPHHPGGGLDQQVVAGPLGIGTVLAEAGDRAIDEPGVDGLQARVVQAVLLQPADLEVLHQDVAVGCHAANQRLAFGLGHVDRDRALVAVARGVVGGLVGIVAVGVLQEGRAPVAGVITAFGPLDLDHVSAQVGQDLGAPRPGQHARKVEYLDACQRTLVACWHVGSFSSRRPRCRSAHGRG